MLVPVETDLSEVVVHLEQATTIPKDRKEEDRSVEGTIEAMKYK